MAQSGYASLLPPGLKAAAESETDIEEIIDDRTKTLATADKGAAVSTADSPNKPNPSPKKKPIPLTLDEMLAYNKSAVSSTASTKPKLIRALSESRLFINPNSK